MQTVMVQMDSSLEFLGFVWNYSYKNGGGYRSFMARQAAWSATAAMTATASVACHRSSGGRDRGGTRSARGGEEGGPRGRELGEEHAALLLAPGARPAGTH